MPSVCAFLVPSTSIKSRALPSRIPNLRFQWVLVNRGSNAEEIILLDKTKRDYNNLVKPKISAAPTSC